MGLGPLQSDRACRRSIRWLLVSILGSSVFCRLTVFGSTFVLFLDHLGLDKARIGLLLSLIPFAGLTALGSAGFVARIGFRRAYISFFAARKVAVGLIALVPWVSSRWGAGAGMAWVAGLIAVFALCRAIGEVGAYAVFQEVVPNAIRGKFGAAAFVVLTTSGIAATAVAGWVLGARPDTGRYLSVIGLGVAAGIVSVAALVFVAGGEPVDRAASEHTTAGEMAAAVRDRAFVTFLCGLGLANLAISLSAFTPLFLKERCNLEPGIVAWLDGATSAGGLAVAALWGRATDRRGGKRVLTAALALGLLAPAAMALPGLVAAQWSAILVTVWVGAASTGWYIGSERYLFVTAIPPERKTGYIAVFYAVAGVASGIGPLAGGWMIDAARRAGMEPYTPAFGCAALVAAAAVVVMTGLRSDMEHASA